MDKVMDKINSHWIQAQVETWAHAKNFTAPYGILTGTQISKKGTRYLTVTFGRARTLDATVEIYNKNFIVVRTNRHGSVVFKNYPDLMAFLDTL
jgi:hypothetical protein